MELSARTLERLGRVLSCLEEPMRAVLGTARAEGTHRTRGLALAKPLRRRGIGTSAVATTAAWSALRVVTISGERRPMREGRLDRPASERGEMV